MGRDGLDAFGMIHFSVFVLLDKELKFSGFGLHLAVLAKANIEFGFQLLKFKTKQGDVFIESLDFLITMLAFPLTVLLDIDIREILFLDQAVLSL